jgi:hypothetical protein
VGQTSWVGFANARIRQMQFSHLEHRGRKTTPAAEHRENSRQVLCRPSTSSPRSGAPRPVPTTTGDIPPAPEEVAFDSEVSAVGRPCMGAVGVDPLVVRLPPTHQQGGQSRGEP